MPTMPNNIAVIELSLGTALGKHLAEKGLTVCLWAYEHDVVESINTAHENTIFLKGITLPQSLTATSSLVEAVKDCQGILFAVPSHAARSVLSELASSLTDARPLVCATKGIEEDSAKLMTQVMEDELPTSMHRSLMVLSGPSFASELTLSRPTAVCLAAPMTHWFAVFKKS